MASKGGEGRSVGEICGRVGKKTTTVLGYISRAVPSALCVALNCSCVAKACHKYVALSGEAIYIFCTLRC